MSDASLPFATELMGQLGIGFVRVALSTEPGERADVNPFNWRIELADGKLVERNEAEATPDFQGWL
jgi:hypothetical protein